MRRIAPFALVATFAAYFAACENAPVGSSGGDLSPRFDVTGTFPDVEDTYLGINRKNKNFGALTFLQVKKLEQDVGLVRFSDAVITSLAASLSGGGSVFLELKIDETFGNWGSAGLPVGVHPVNSAPGWTEVGATWNCGADANVSNNQPNCPGGGWTWDPAGARPIVQAPTDVVTIMGGQTGTVSFEVTADILAFDSGTPNNGWAVARTSANRSAYLRFTSSESGMPPILRFEPCSEEDINELDCTSEIVGEGDPFVIGSDGGTGTGANIVAFGSDGLQFENTDEEAVIFKLDVLSNGPCEDIPNAVDVGPCVEITAFDLLGNPIPDIGLIGNGEVAFCVNYAGSGTDLMPDGSAPDPENEVEPDTRIADELLIHKRTGSEAELLQPFDGPASAALDCDDFENGLAASGQPANPLLRLARAAVTPILSRFLPKPLNATSALTHTKRKGGLTESLSVFHWTSALVLFSSGGWNAGTQQNPVVGTDWQDDNSFFTTTATLPAGAPGSGCLLYSSASDLNFVWPVGSDSQIFLRRAIETQQVHFVDAAGTELHLLVSVGIDNDIEVIANDGAITGAISDRGAHTSASNTLPKPGGGGPANHSTNGFDGLFLKHEGCAFRDQTAGDHITGDITFAIPVDLIAGFGVGDLQLAIRGRDRGGSSFLDVQVSLMELPELIPE